MCDGKLGSKRDVVILSIKPKRPDYPTNQKYVPVSVLLQEWDKLDAYYRGQLLKLTKSFTKSAHKAERESKQHQQKKSSSRHHSPNNAKKSKSSCPVKKHSSSLASDQFTELFGDENLFSPTADTNNNSRNRHHSSSKSNHLLHSRSLNDLFDDKEDLDDDDDLLPAPPPSSRSRSISSSRKNSLSSVNGNLVVSIPVLSVQQQHDRYGSGTKHKRLTKYFSDDDETASSGVSENDSEDDDVDEPENFLSVPRDNFQVQYGLKQKTRVALLEKTPSVCPRFIVPIRVAPYKPPTAQGLNGVQIQKILYHKNDKINYASPTTTTAKTPDKPPDQSPFPTAAVATSLTKPASKVSSENNSPVSTVSPRSGNSTVTTPSSHSLGDNNNATPKQPASQSPPDFASPKSDQGYKSSSSTSSAKLSPPINSTTGNHSQHHRHQQKLKRPGSLTENYSSYSSTSSHSKKSRFGGAGSDSLHSADDRSPSGYPFHPVTSSNYAFSSLSTASSYSSSSGSLCGDAFAENEHHSQQQHHPNSPPRSRHSSTSSSSSASSSRFNAPIDNATTPTMESSSKPSGSPSVTASKHKLNIINKNPSFNVKKPPSTSSSLSSAGDQSVFRTPAAVSITDRIIQKASRPQPELLERQRRRKMESNQRKSYALKMGDEQEERESIDLSMKSFEMIWDVPLLSPLRSP